MPHAESPPSREPVTTNGEKPTSQFLSHLTSYPLVHDSINLYKSTPPGAYSLHLLFSAQHTFLDPLAPYARTPLSYISPYLSAADSIANDGLTQLESRVPLVKQDTVTVRDTLAGYALAPVTVPLTYGKEGKDYLFGVYGREKKGVSEEGVVGTGKAMVGTGLVVLGEVVKRGHEWVVRKERGFVVKAKEVKDRAHIE